MEKIHASKLLAGLMPAGFLTSDPEVELVTTDSVRCGRAASLWPFPVSGSTATTLRPKHWKRVQSLWW